MATLPPFQRYQNRGFTLIELLVTIAIVAVLGSLVVGSWGKIRERSVVTGCSVNLRQIFLGLTQFANEHENVYPQLWNDTGVWSKQLVDGGYIKDTRVFKCPGDTINVKPAGEARSYSYCSTSMSAGKYVLNSPTTNRLTFEHPSRQYILGEWHSASPYATWDGGDSLMVGWDIVNTPIAGHAKAGRSFLFADGHVEQRSVAQCASPHSGWVYNEFP